MPANAADDDLLDALARRLDTHALRLEALASNVGNECSRFGYWYAATQTSAIAATAGRFAGDWSTSVDERVSVLRTYEEIALVGSAAAGGAGPALGAARTWAFSNDSPEPFADWYNRVYAAAQEKSEQIAAGRALAARFGEDDLLNDQGELITELAALDADGLEAFFTMLGADRTNDIVAWFYPIEQMSQAFDDDFETAFIEALARAWDVGALSADFKSEFVETAGSWEELWWATGYTEFPSGYLGMVGAKLVGEGPRADYGRNPTNSIFTYSDVIPQIEEILTTDADAAAAFAASPLWLRRREEPDDEYLMLEDWVLEVLRTAVDPAAGDFTEVVTGLATYAGEHGVDEPAFRALLTEWASDPAYLAVLAAANRYNEAGVDWGDTAPALPPSTTLSREEAHEFLDAILVDPGTIAMFETAAWDHVQSELEAAAGEPGAPELTTAIAYSAALLSLSNDSITRSAIDDGQAANAAAATDEKITEFILLNLALVAVAPQGVLAKGGFTLAKFLGGQVIDFGGVDVDEVHFERALAEMEDADRVELLTILAIAGHNDENGLLDASLLPDPDLYPTMADWLDALHADRDIDDILDEVFTNWRDLDN